MRRYYPVMVERTARAPGSLLLLVGVVLAFGCGGEKKAESESAAVPFVEAVQAGEGALPLEERVSGIVKAENQVAIRPELTGPIVEVLVRNGDSVRRGQPLVRQDASNFASQVREAEAAARVAEAAAAEESARVRELEARVARFRSLAGESLVSPQDIETLEAQLAGARASAAQAVARVEQAEASLADARRDLGRTTIRAPIDGTVGRRDAETGMIAGPSDVLFVIGNLDMLIIEVPLTEEMLRSVKEGQPVRVSSSLLEGGSMSATLSRISPFLRAESMTTTGEIDVRNPEGRLQPGMFVEVDLLYGESGNATLVPTSALWEDPRTRQMTVWVTGSAPSDTETPVRLERREVTILGEGQMSAAVGNVKPGEWAVVVGQHLLEGESIDARVRTSTWERVESLQRLQREDVLRAYLERQAELAKTLGARPMSNEEFLGGGAAAAPVTQGGS